MPADLFRVVDPGLLTSVQEVEGRTGWKSQGIPECGCLDKYSGTIANLLVGNDVSAPLIEVTLTGLRLQFLTSAVVALAGADLSPRISGRRAPMYSSISVSKESELAFQERLTGCRAYMAVAGELALAPILGSRTTDLRSGFGGFQGRAFRTGDVLQFTPPNAPPVLRTAHPLAHRSGPMMVLPGPHIDLFPAGALEQLAGSEWSVTVNADRMGYRLEGDVSIRSLESHVPSLPIAIGAVEVPPDGRPIVMLADRPVTGGYPVLAVVASAEVARLAQLRPGDGVRFVVSTVSSARRLAALLEGQIARSVEVDQLANAGWAGALPNGLGVHDALS